MTKKKNQIKSILIIPNEKVQKSPTNPLIFEPLFMSKTVCHTEYGKQQKKSKLKKEKNNK